MLSSLCFATANPTREPEPAPAYQTGSPEHKQSQHEAVLGSPPQEGSAGLAAAAAAVADQESKPDMNRLQDVDAEIEYEITDREALRKLELVKANLRF